MADGRSARWPGRPATVPFTVPAGRASPGNPSGSSTAARPAGMPRRAGAPAIPRRHGRGEATPATRPVCPTTADSRGGSGSLGRCRSSGSRRTTHRPDGLLVKAASSGPCRAPVRSGQHVRRAASWRRSSVSRASQRRLDRDLPYLATGNRWSVAARHRPRGPCCRRRCAITLRGSRSLGSEDRTGGGVAGYHGVDGFAQDK
jgi:hypothetical protein